MGLGVSYHFILSRAVVWAAPKFLERAMGWSMGVCESSGEVESAEIGLPGRLLRRFSELVLSAVPARLAPQASMVLSMVFIVAAGISNGPHMLVLIPR